MSEELHVLLMGYLDGELDDADKARVEEALAADPALKREYDEMRRLKELADDAGLDAKSDAELQTFWDDVYNRLERHTAWILLTIGATGLLVAGCLMLFFSHVHWGIKAAFGAVGIGALLMLWSVWRERMRLLPHDRYHREVHR